MEETVRMANRFHRPLVKRTNLKKWSTLTKHERWDLHEKTPVYNFLIKNAVQDFLLYNEFDQNITKDSDPVRQTYYTMKKL